MSTPILDPMVKEEIQLLDKNRQILLENPIGYEDAETDLVEQLKTLRDEVLVAKEEDLPTLYSQMDQLNAALTAMKKLSNKEEVDPDSPYFAHMRLEEDGKKRDVFLGKATNLDNGLRIVDWRHAPVSKLFYRYSEGDEYEEEFGDVVKEGEIIARRILLVQDGELLRVANSKTTFIKEEDSWRELAQKNMHLSGGQGTALRAGSSLTSQLGAGAQLRSSKHLPEISALIDPEQFELISAEHDSTMVIRGSAGSGKTTVALHRLSYLCFSDPKRFAPENMMFIVWNRAMRDYVSHVLPHLGVNNLTVKTWEQWSTAVLKQAIPIPKLDDEMADDAVRRVKLHPKTAKRLEEWIASTPTLPATWQQVYEDWAEVLTDTYAIKNDLTEQWTMQMEQRAQRLLAHQTDLISVWLENKQKQELGQTLDEEDATSEDPYIDVEDIALLLRAYQLRIGKLSDNQGSISLSHLVVDEVQDFSPIEILVLLDICDSSKSVTFAGDTRQHISKAAGFSSWTEFLSDVGVKSTALSTLEVSYRSTRQIVHFAMGLLKDDDEAAPRTVKDGPPVEFFTFSDHGACVAFLAEELRQLQRSEPRANVALITPDVELAEEYYNGLEKCELDCLRLVDDQNFAFAPGIDVVDVEQVKGLEFDYVVIIEANATAYPNTPHHQRLLHVAATRAVHQLWLTCVGTPTSLLPEIDDEN